MSILHYLGHPAAPNTCPEHSPYNEQQHFVDIMAHNFICKLCAPRIFGEDLLQLLGQLKGYLSARDMNRIVRRNTRFCTVL
jgi:hypothetical protein